ncbi:tetratricopeptide repeat protein [Thermosynechococcaceae cyanobacterium BACA0444]|uniref:Tetratricopeptide repeat protein n=1 Tax=Pseudocalidococcus azoricus BACA0444 TaxID=2918990 RepID=A0AAE4FSF2_9CYAN|nr:tetratricopeptide repeat protein [Pseudocalidococcus azoricus]MDS3861305.1 tetratricopeptide repeat protein [Pseudocalidococcus azoricus BACA0444]
MESQAQETAPEIINNPLSSLPENSPARDIDCLTQAPAAVDGGFNYLEMGSALIAVATSIAGAAFQNLLLTSIATLPLSASLVMNLAERKKLAQKLQAEIAQHHMTQSTLIQTQTNHANQLGNLMAGLAQVSDQVQGVQGQVSDLGRGTRDLHDYTRILGTEQKQIEEVVDCLRQIENYTQAIQSDPSHAKAYYNRGLTHQRLGDAEAAVLDYTEAIQVNDTYAKAYHNRGVARAAIGDRKGAVTDLRTAAKHFFEQGDITSYQRARDLAKRVHEVGDPAKDSKEVPLELLFS